VTRRLDAVYAEEQSRLDPAAMTAQLKTLARESW